MMRGQKSRQKSGSSGWGEESWSTRYLGGKGMENSRMHPGHTHRRVMDLRILRLRPRFSSTSRTL